jgi:hypothetical protein
MGNSNNGGIVVVIIWLITILISILSGVLAWNWIEPESFWGAIGFIVLWGIISTIGHYLALGIVALFGGMK